VKIVPFTDDHADDVVQWIYEAPYDRYDTAADADLVDLLTKAELRSGVRAVVEDEALIGYFNFVKRDDEIHLGLGLRPELTGRGLGSTFVEAGLTYARDKWAPARFRLWVAAFNVRAILVYERAGFVAVRSACRLSDRLEFVEMESQA
jgi:ribosomal-protein-alanine N-acetyltransferase